MRGIRMVSVTRHHCSVAQRKHARVTPSLDESQVTCSDEEVVLQHNWHELRLFMWDYMGIVRTNKRLERAMRRIQLLQQETHEYYSNFRVSNNLLEMRNLLQVAELMVRCAMQRKESRGLHYTLDYPDQLAESGPTILVPENNALSACNSNQEICARSREPLSSRFNRTNNCR